MGACDMCGAEGFLLKALIEGTELKVCKNCAKYGKVVGKVYVPNKKVIKNKKVEQKKQKEPEVLQVVVVDYSKRIREAREKMNLTQEDFAKKIAEKESLVQHMETKRFKPSLELAKKLEKLLGIKLIEEYEDNENYSQAKKSKEVTIGDFIKIKKRK